MARISSYPVVTPKAIDTLIISQGYDIDADEPIEGNPTGSVTIGSVIDLVNTGLVPGTGTVTSLGVSMPSAFTVSNSPVTSVGTIAITGAGTTSQYIDGTGSLQDSANQALDTTSDVTFSTIAGNGASITNIDKYTTAQVDGFLALKANQATTYTKTETDALIISEEVANGNYIYTTNNKRYSIQGLTHEQKGDQLKLAMSEIPSNNWIFLPPGDYYSATGFVWTQRDAGIIGLGGSSKACHLYSDSAHTFHLDTSYLLYNSVHKNFAVSQTGTGSIYDAIHIGPSTGSGIDQSQLDLDLHISEADRDGFHVEKNVISGRFNFKTTGQIVTTSVGRYMVYAANSSGFNVNLDNNQESIAFLDSTTSNIGILLRATIISGGNEPFKLIDNGTNNGFMSLSSVNSFKRSSEIENARIPSPVLELPASKVAAFYPFNSIVDSNFLDESIHQNDAAITGGITLTDTAFGNIAVLDGTDGQAVIPANTTLQAITSKIIVSVIVEVNQESNGYLINSSEIKLQYEHDDAKLNLGVNIGGSVRSRGVTGIEQNKKYLLTYCYNGTEYFLKKNTIEPTRSNTTGAVSIGNSNISIGKISSNYFAGKISSLFILNDCTDELIEAVESTILLNSNNLGTEKNRGEDNNVYADTNFLNSSKGIILKDRTNSNSYRLLVTGGVLGIETV